MLTSNPKDVGLLFLLSTVGLIVCLVLTFLALIPTWLLILGYVLSVLLILIGALRWFFIVWHCSSVVSDSVIEQEEKSNLEKFGFTDNELLNWKCNTIHKKCLRELWNYLKKNCRLKELTVA